MLALLAAGFLALGVAEARADAPTFDEPVYVSAGLAALLHHDVTLNDEHPPLPKVLAVLPVLFPPGAASPRRTPYGARRAPSCSCAASRRLPAAAAETAASRGCGSR